MIHPLALLFYWSLVKTRLKNLWGNRAKRREQRPGNI